MLVIDKLRQERAKSDGGSDLWQAALDRAIELVTPIWGNKELVWDGPLLADGGVALALAIYIVAREENIPVDQVTRGQVEFLNGPWNSRVENWERRLRSLGVDLGNEHDPMIVKWRELIYDYRHPEFDPVDLFQMGGREGSLLGEVFGFVLAPIWNFTF
jgi:hypothetical protein